MSTDICCVPIMYQLRLQCLLSPQRSAILQFLEGKTKMNGKKCYQNWCRFGACNHELLVCKFWTFFCSFFCFVLLFPTSSCFPSPFFYPLPHMESCVPRSHANSCLSGAVMSSLHLCPCVNLALTWCLSPHAVLRVHGLLTTPYRKIFKPTDL